MANFSRRQFLGFTALGLAGGVSVKAWQRWRGRDLLTNAQTIDPEPLVYRSENGLLEVELKAQYRDLQLADQLIPAMMTYNGQIPAPRLEVKPGDLLRIQLKNTLDQPTNLHFHGLHLSPEGKQDNVFRHIEPKGTFTYELDIHPEQRAGTYWYHPHLHGFTAEQLSRGLAGIIVVRGDLDDIPEIAAAQEEFLLLQDFAVTGGDRQGQGGMMGMHQGQGRGQVNNVNFMAGREGQLQTVNGLHHPTIQVSKDLLRLRLVNGSTSRFYRLQLNGHQLTQIATDGGALPSPIVVDEIMLTPGQRAEVLIPAAELPEIPIHLVNLPYQRTNMGMMGSQYRDGTEAIADLLRTPKTFAQVAIPKELSTIEPLPEPVQTRRFTLNHGMVPGQGMAFLINGEPYQHQSQDLPQTVVKLDTIEDWELVNTDVMDHPFHVHVNKFQIISRNGIPETTLAWHDTVLVRIGETVKIRIAFRDFTGETVYHCHILDHEDLGMMGKLKIEPA
jgi:FtsP/CotA-like multicopper oxidase with cupredoxin domain